MKIKTKPQAFISHSSKDNSVAQRLASDFRSHGLSVWIDSERIKYGQSIPRAIEQGLAESDCILVLVSNSFLESKWCRAEYEPLLVKEIESDALLVVPILIEDCTLPLLLRNKKYCDLRYVKYDTESYERYSNNISELAQQIRSIYTEPDATDNSTVDSVPLLGTPTWRLQKTLKTLTPPALLGDKLKKSNRDNAINLLQEVTTLIEKFEMQYDELVTVLNESAYADSAYGSADRITKNRILQANRKLMNISNEMRSIFRNVEKRFLLSPDIKEAIDSITKTCLQIAIVEDILVIQGVENSDGVTFSLEQQHELLDASLHDQTIRTEIGIWRPDKSEGESLIDSYHLMLILLNDYKISLRETVMEIERA